MSDLEKMDRAELVEVSNNPASTPHDRERAQELLGGIDQVVNAVLATDQAT